MAQNNYFFLKNCIKYIDYILNDEKINLLEYATNNLETG